MTLGLVGKKMGMTREFFNSGVSIPVTVVKIEKGRVIDILTKEKNGYSAVKLGFLKKKNSKLSKQMKGFFAKKNTEPKKILKEYRVDNIDNFKTGSEIGLEILKKGEAYADKKDRWDCLSPSFISSAGWIDWQRN